MRYFEGFVARFDVGLEGKKFDISGGLAEQSLFWIGSNGIVIFLVVFGALVIIFVVVHPNDSKYRIISLTELFIQISQIK